MGLGDSKNFAGKINVQKNAEAYPGIVDQNYFSGKVFLN